MVSEIPFLKEPNVPGLPNGRNSLDFATLYDRYAPALLGVITRIVSDNELAVELLATTFIKARSEISTYRPEKQPIFSWLLVVARRIGLDALREQAQSSTRSVQLTSSGKVIALPTNGPKVLVRSAAKETNSKLTELLDSVLFNNCTPEEAARTLGLPVETARQQLRQALKQLRSTQQAS
ncbi:sigma-70 family RNA polymerase sigma factor [Spirosoma sp.]|uniref:RNA polymerase sigma factor n=1 Tax=Spirosoma sp. TaxID=1899569 RepID=UPI002610A732|nr:sigma-70 family RNA polymerase sigma factor [Spirosoma sp.]MCX6218444.1 sigma-70 family RNA polymerase sigma factor [Spirosoma sp.]